METIIYTKCLILILQIDILTYIFDILMDSKIRFYGIFINQGAGSDPGLSCIF